jgi:poly(rC)-binding protein 3/4
MAAAKPHFLPHAAFATASSSSSRSPSAAADAEAGLAVFRLLLPPSFSDADTMRLYAAVNPLRRRTAALQVRVEPLDPAAAGGRVVAAVLGPAATVRRAEASSSSAEPLVLSPAQEALFAVLDAEGALYCADQEGPRGGKGGGPSGCATCLLLVDADRLQAATAGGGVLGRIALEAGAYVRVVPWEEAAPQPQGQPPEEVVEVYHRSLFYDLFKLVALDASLNCYCAPCIAMPPFYCGRCVGYVRDVSSRVRPSAVSWGF